jgi:hypothetical protein
LAETDLSFTFSPMDSAADWSALASTATVFNSLDIPSVIVLPVAPASSTICLASSIDPFRSGSAS